LDSDAKTVAAQLDSQKSRIDNMIAKYQQQYSDAESKWRGQFSHMLDRHDMEFKKAEGERTKRVDTELSILKGQIVEQSEGFGSEVSEHQNRVTAATEKYEEIYLQHKDDLESHLQEVRKEVDDAIKQSEAQTQELRVRLERQAEEVLEELRVHKESAEKIVGVTATTGMAGGYKGVADQERTAKFWWNIVTVASMLGLISAAILTFVATKDIAFSWSAITGRVLIMAACGILAAYGAKQVSWHNVSERFNRGMALELASIDPYLVRLPEEVQNDIKQVLAERLFGQQILPKDRKGDKTTGSTVDFAKLVEDLVRNYVRTALKEFKDGAA